MKVVFKILAVIFGIASIGQLAGGNIFFIGIMLAIVFGYFGWKADDSEKKDLKSTVSDDHERFKPQAGLSLGKKYPVLVEYIKSGDKRIKIIEDKSKLIKLGLLNVGGDTVFTLSLDSSSLNVNWDVDSPVFGKHSKSWSFELPVNEDHVIETMTTELQQYQLKLVKGTQFEESKKPLQQEPSRSQLIYSITEKANGFASKDGLAKCPTGKEGEKYFKAAYDDILLELTKSFNSDVLIQLQGTLDDVYSNVLEFNS